MQQKLIWFEIAFKLLMLILLTRLVIRLALIVFGFKEVLPYVPTSPSMMRKILKTGELNGRKKIIDLGCGTGSMLAAIGKANPEAELVGVERSRVLVLLARLRFIHWKNKPRIVHGDMFDFDISDADAIVGFWITGLMPRLLAKFEKECKPGCVIVSHVFSLPKSEIIFKLKDIGEKSRKAHFYKKRV